MTDASAQIEAHCMALAKRRRRYGGLTLLLFVLGGFEIADPRIGDIGIPVAIGVIAGSTVRNPQPLADLDIGAAWQNALRPAGRSCARR